MSSEFGVRNLKRFNESQNFREKNQKYKELAELLQSEILDDYDIYEGPLSERDDGNRNYTNEPCWHFENAAGDRGPIYGIDIFPRNRITQEGRETTKKNKKGY